MLTGRVPRVVRRAVVRVVLQEEGIAVLERPYLVVLERLPPVVAVVLVGVGEPAAVLEILLVAVAAGQTDGIPANPIVAGDLEGDRAVGVDVEAVTGGVEFRLIQTIRGPARAARRATLPPNHRTG